MQTEFLAALSLSLAIACSWSRFRTIFSQATDNAILLSPATVLASAICLSSFGLAFSTESIKTGGLVISLGLLLSILIEKSPVRAPIAVALGLASLFLICNLSGVVTLFG